MSRYLTDEELNVIRAEDFAALFAEVDRLRAENRKLRDVLAWTEAQCPGKCAGVCGDVLDTGWPLGDDTDPERTRRRLVREVLAEVERLHGNAEARERVMRQEEIILRTAERERDHFREAWAKAQVRLDCGADAIEAIREERAAVVRFLRDQANAEHPTERGVPSLSPAGRGLLLLNADRIERGEHLKKEEEP